MLSDADKSITVYNKDPTEKPTTFKEASLNQDER
jgi:hypothetical protein